MALSTSIKNALNRVLARANLQMTTLTARRAQDRQLAKLRNSDHFDRAIFPWPENIEAGHQTEIIDALPDYRSRFDTFLDGSLNDVGYSFANDYFRSPDAEVFYTLVRMKRPARIVEVGSGYSTKIARQAIIDGKLETRLISIDPEPRAEIDSLADECVRRPVEDVDLAIFDQLQTGDMLFIDSSHQVQLGNDCAFLYTVVLPRLVSGMFLHVHDIFLPFDYPSDFVADAREWNEQYLVHVMLLLGNAFDITWPGYFLQQTRRDFMSAFPNNRGERAQSLWLRKTSSAIRGNDCR